MAKTDKTKCLKSSLKNTKAKVKRRDERIANLEAEIEELKAEVKKKATEQSLLNITREYQAISSRSSSSDTLSCSDAKQMRALEILSRLLKD